MFSAAGAVMSHRAGDIDYYIEYMQVLEQCLAGL